MSVIIILIVISVLVAVFFVGVFIWAVKTGQYDDTYSPSVRVLFDDKRGSKSKLNRPHADQKEKKDEGKRKE